MRTKLEALKTSTDVFDYDIFCITETWLTPDIKTPELGLSTAFNVYRLDRSELTSSKSRGGGVLIAVAKKYKSRLIKTQFNNIEHLFIDITVNNDLKLLIGCAYIPPNSNNSIYLNHMSDVERICQSLPLYKYIIVGDYNLPGVNWSIEGAAPGIVGDEMLSDIEREVVDSINFLGLYQLNTNANLSGRILDLVMSDDPTVHVSLSTTAVLPIDLYHPPLAISVDSRKVEKARYTERRFEYSDANYRSINDALFQADWSPLESLPLDESVDYFYNVISDIRDRHIPTKTLYTDSYPRWFTKELKNMISRKKRAHKVYKRSGHADDYRKFSDLRRECQTHSRLCFDRFVVGVESSICFNTKRIFKYSKSLRGEDTSLPGVMHYGTSTSDSVSQTLKLFADYFKGVYDGCSMVDDGYEFRSDINLQLSGLNVEIRDILKEIGGMESKSSSGPDGIPPIFIKGAERGFLFPLYVLFNRSISEGIFPTKWKHSFLVPIFKSGDRQDVTNYRPVCIQSCIPKLLEKVILLKISSSIHSIVSPLQHGFMPARSTQTNLVVYEEFIVRAFSQRLQVDSIYTDFSKAFDRVNHIILLKKLSGMGVCGSLLAWVRDYLRGRSLCVSLCQTTSYIFTVQSGVPQGSHLGPILFNLFINDITDIFDGVEVLLFADDLKIYRSVRDIRDCELLQRNIDALGEWCDLNKLCLNTKKCQVMRFHRIKLPILFNYRLNVQSLESVRIIRDLGVTLDVKMSLNAHVNGITDKAMRLLGFIIRICRPFSNLYTLKVVYVSLVRSILEFSSVVWSPYYAVHKAQIERVQRKFLRHINFRLGIPYDRLDYGLLSDIMGLSDLSDRRILLDLSFLHKIVNSGIDCPNILELLNFHIPVRSTRQSVTFGIVGSNTNYALNSPINRMSRWANEFSQLDIFSDGLDKFKTAARVALQNRDQR
jgi:hypothetical protein